MSLAEIRIARFDATSGSPVFSIDVGSNTSYVLDLAALTDLFDPAGPARDAGNYYSSGVVPLPAGGAAEVTIPAPTWAQLRTQPRIYYRLTSLAGTLASMVRSLPPTALHTAPWIDLRMLAGVSSVDWNNERDTAMPLEVIRMVGRFDGGAPPHPPATLTGTVRNSGRGFSADVTLHQTGDADSTYASDALLLAVPGSDTNPGFIEIPACPGDSIEFALHESTAALTVLEADDDYQVTPCQAVPDVPEVTLEAVGALSVTVDPQSLPVGAAPTGAGLVVMLRDADGNPIENESIIWTIDTYAFEGFTDAQGRCELGFVLGQRGLFGIVIDNLPVIDPTTNTLDPLLTDGTWTVEAAPGMELLGALADADAVRFTVDLVRPTVLEFIDASASAITQIARQQEFFVRVRLGRAAMAGHPAGQPVTVEVSTTSGDTLTESAEPVLAGQGIYETRTRIRVLDSASLAVNNDITCADGGTVHVRCMGSGAAMPCFNTEIVAAEFEINPLLDELHDAFTRLAANPPAPSDALVLDGWELKRRLAANALAWRNEPHPSGRHRLAVSRAYVEMLSSEDWLGPIAPSAAATAGFLPTSLQGTTIVYACLWEAQTVIAALGNASGFVWTSMGSIPGNIGAAVAESARNFRKFFSSWENIRDALASPLIGGYTVLTGNTANGARATMLEKIMGGTEAVLALATAPMALASVTRAATTLPVRAAMLSATAGTTAAAGFGALARGIGSLSLRASATVALEAARAIARGDRNALKLITRSGRASRYLEARLRDLEAVTSQIADARTRLANLEAQLPGATGTNQRRLRATRDNLVQDIAAANRRKLVLERKVDFHRNVKARADRAFSNYRAGNILTPDSIRAALAADPNWLPRPWDWINGQFAHQHFERVIGGRLSANGFQSGPGTGVRLHTSYYSPRIRNGSLGARLGRTMAPRMDHLNPVTRQVADSKYYLFDDAVSGGQLTARGRRSAREIADTLEKGRLVQGELIFGAKVPLNEALAFELFQRTATIYSPVQVPGLVMQEIARLIGPRAAAAVRYEVVRPDVLAWATGP